MVISNGILELTLVQSAAGAALTSLRHVAMGAAARVSVDMVYYESGGSPRQSGAYIFAPAGFAQPVQLLLLQFGLVHAADVVHAAALS